MFRNNLKKPEALVGLATVVLWFVGLVYVFRANELMKMSVPGLDRLLVGVILILGVMKNSQDVPLLIYRGLQRRKGRA